jgi:hypothetical protein
VFVVAALGNGPVFILENGCDVKYLWPEMLFILDSYVRLNVSILVGLPGKVDVIFYVFFAVLFVIFA